MNNRHSQMYVYNTNEVSREILFNPNFHSMNQQTQVHY